MRSWWHLFSSMIDCYNGGVLREVVVFEEWSCRDCADMCERTHNSWDHKCTCHRVLLCLTGQSPAEAYSISSRCVCLSMCYSAVQFSSRPEWIKQCMEVAMDSKFYGLEMDSKFSCIQLEILNPPNWLNFWFKALLSSYSMMCSPWRPLSVIKSSVKSKLPKMNYLSPWKVHQYYKIDGDSSKIVRTSVLKLSSLSISTLLASLMMTCLIWHMSKLSMCSFVNSLFPLFC